MHAAFPDNTRFSLESEAVEEEFLLWIDLQGTQNPNGLSDKTSLNLRSSLKYLTPA